MKRATHAVVMTVAVLSAGGSALAQSASQATIAANQQVPQSLPFGDTSDFEDAKRGFIGTLDDPAIRSDAGQVVYDAGKFDFLEASAPDTVNPSLWRISQLNAINGVFKVTDGIYQVRGLDVSNVSFIRGKTGWIIVDPLMSIETARAAIKLLNERVGALPVSAIIFTHSHLDHFGGSKGVPGYENVPVYAPVGFFEEAVKENVLAGNHMARRANYMYGNILDKSPTASLSSGLGLTTSVGIGTPTLIPANHTITGGADGGPQTETVDGVQIDFFFVPDAEAPTELMFYLPQSKALMQAELLNHSLHNLYSLRGAKVRNGLLWSKYLQAMIARYGDDVQISFGSHHWPTWGNERIINYWKGQRDVYRYIHDQTLRLANHGKTMLEVGEDLKLPDSLYRQFAVRDYYGSVNHNAKAQYQLYFGWFSGNPSELNELPPVEEGEKFVEYAGGADAVIAKARVDYAAGQYRWVATALNHLVFADPGNTEAKNLLADTLTQLGYQAESATWRNFYLAGAKELREGIQVPPEGAGSADIVRAMDLESFLDFLGVALNGPKAAATGPLSFNLVMPDTGDKAEIGVENGTLHYTLGEIDPKAQATVTVNRSVMDQINFAGRDMADAIKTGDMKVEGDESVLGKFFGLLDKFDPNFPIVTP